MFVSSKSRTARLADVAYWRDVMFVIVAYDVGVKRVSKVMKVCRRYLFHVQRSVFEGHITDANLRRLKKDLEAIIEPKLDGVCVYEFESVKYAKKEVLGATLEFSSVID